MGGFPRGAGNSLRVAGNSLRVVGDSLRVLGDSLRVVGNSLRVLGDSLRVVGDSLRVPGDSLRVVGDSLRVLGNSPRVLGNSPRVLGNSPRVAGNPLRVAGDIGKAGERKRKPPGDGLGHRHVFHFSCRRIPAKCHRVISRYIVVTFSDCQSISARAMALSCAGGFAIASEATQSVECMDSARRAESCMAGHSRPGASDGRRPAGPTVRSGQASPKMNRFFISAASF
jgi:hypothetical protein